MAKDTKAKSAAKNTAKQPEKEFAFGVNDLAKLMGIEPASVRIQLRNKEIAKAGKSYGWDTKKALEEVAAKLRASKGEAKPVAKPKVKAAGTEKTTSAKPVAKKKAA